MPVVPFACRACGGVRNRRVLSLGNLPLANGLLDAVQLAALEEPTYPLELVFCESCSLAQITETVPPPELFREYVYFSSFSDAAVEHARALVERIIHERSLDSWSLAAEIASNDGYLLQHYVCRGILVLGIEPALNVGAIAERRGVRTVPEFFGTTLARRLVSEGLQADVIHANNVLAHVPDLADFVEGIRVLLKRGGLAVIEVPYVRDMVDRLEFDTIYHEHLSYFSLTALDRVFRDQRLLITDVERLAIHGGSLRLFVSHEEVRIRNERVARLLSEELRLGLVDGRTYSDFGERVQRLRDQLRAFLAELRQSGKRLAGYGASAKGATLLNYCGLGRETLDFIADRSTRKQGLFTPGSHLPIVDPEQLIAEQPDYVLLLTWNFADEILAQQTEYRRRGGRFIIPVPSPRVM